MSLSTLSATVVDPSGQAFAFGTWQLYFKQTFGTPGIFTDGGAPFTRIYGGTLDGTGSFSQAVNRNDTISPAGSLWTLIVSPNANGQSFQVDLNVNSPAFNASTLINGVITNIQITATAIAHAYKDSEVVPVPGTGGLYFDATRKTLKIYDPTTLSFLEFNSATLPLLLNPLTDQFINQPVGTNLLVNRFENTFYVDNNTPGADMGAKINTAIGLVSGGIIDATFFQGAQSAAATILLNKPIFLKLGAVTLSLSGSPGINLASNGASVVGLGWGITNLSTTSGTADVVQTNALGNFTSHFSIVSSVARTAGAGLHPKGGDGIFQRISIDKTFNGINLSDSLGGANGNNRYIDIIMGSIASAGNWNCGLFIGNIAAGTIPVQLFDRLIIQGGPYATAMIQIDSGADTLFFTDGVFSVSSDSPGIIVANNNTAQNPHLIRFRNCVVEPGPTKECFTIFNTQSLSIENCSLDDCVRAIDIVGGKDINIEGCTIDGPQAQGITVSTATGVRIVNNRIADCSFAANGASNSIEIGAGLTDFIIKGNDFTSISSVNKPGVNVNVEAGASDRYIITENIFANNVSGGIADNGTGTNKFIHSNSPAVIPNLFKNDLASRRLRANQGTALAIGDFVASGGFGTTAAFTVALGKDQAGQVTITPGGAGIAANPTVTLTFHDGTWTTIPIVVVSRGDLNAPTTGFWIVSSVSATQVVFTFVGLPVSGTSYVLQFVTMGV